MLHNHSGVRWRRFFFCVSESGSIQPFGSHRLEVYVSHRGAERGRNTGAPRQSRGSWNMHQDQGFYPSVSSESTGLWMKRRWCAPCRGDSLSCSGCSEGCARAWICPHHECRRLSSVAAFSGGRLHDLHHNAPRDAALTVFFFLMTSASAYVLRVCD